jgi:glucokinase
MPKPVVVGIDLGGTRARTGAFDRAGDLLAFKEMGIEAGRGFEAGLERIAALIDETLAACDAPDLQGIGISSTGPVDVQHGVINNPLTLPTWENVPIVSRLEKRFGAPGCIENDGDAAALGEYWRGAGRGVRRLYAVTVGTGIGAACIIDGQIYRGMGGFHPEGGHQVIDPSGPPCYCGARGCWESLASGPAIARRARELAQADPAGQGAALLSMAGGDLERIDARMVAEAARQGDPLAGQVLDRAAYYLALGIFNIIFLFFPEVIVLSGGVMRSVDLFMPAIRRMLEQANTWIPARQVRITPAELGYHAGMYGAAYAIWKKLGRIA